MVYILVIIVVVIILLNILLVENFLRAQYIWSFFFLGLFLVFLIFLHLPCESSSCHLYRHTLYIVCLLVFYSDCSDFVFVFYFFVFLAFVFRVGRNLDTRFVFTFSCCINMVVIVFLCDPFSFFSNQLIQGCPFHM